MSREARLQDELPVTAFAGFWVRLGAYFLDYLILIVPSLILKSAVGAVVGSNKSPAFTLLYLAIATLFGMTYFAFLQAQMNGTFGKKICGLLLLSDDGKTLGVGQSLGRYFMWGVSAVVLGLGFVWAGRDKHKQGWHDKVAGTVVVKRAEYSAWKQKQETESPSFTRMVVPPPFKKVA